MKGDRLRELLRTADDAAGEARAHLFDALRGLGAPPQ